MKNTHVGVLLSVNMQAEGENLNIHEQILNTIMDDQFVGNKAKGRNSKRVFEENKACQIFRKNEHF